MNKEVADVVTALGTALAAIAAAGSIAAAVAIAGTQKKLAQRQLLVPLWEYLSSLNEVDPKKPVTKDVIKNVNTLELVALCCEGGMVDELVIRRTFRDGFIKHYDAIDKHPVPKLHLRCHALLAQQVPYRPAGTVEHGPRNEAQ
jgi:hypothetical protein